MKAKEDYKEFCTIFDGIPFEDVKNKAQELGLSLGAEWSNKLKDINFKSICATCVNKDGVSKVSKSIEIYDENGIFVGNLIFD